MPVRPISSSSPEVPRRPQVSSKHTTTDTAKLFHRGLVGPRSLSVMEPEKKKRKVQDQRTKDSSEKPNFPRIAPSQEYEDLKLHVYSTCYVTRIGLQRKCKFCAGKLKFGLNLVQLVWRHLVVHMYTLSSSILWIQATHVRC